MKRINPLVLTFGLAVLVCMPMYAQDWTSTYKFETIKYPDDTFTQTLGINNSDTIAGYHGATVNKGFTRARSGTFTNENFPNSSQTQVIGINNDDKTSGFYIDDNGKTHGFTDFRGSFLKVDYPGTSFNQLLSQNDLGQAAGYYSTKADGTGPDHAYIYDELGGVFELLNLPGSATAQATGSNNSEKVCGFFVEANGVNHGFLLIGRQFSLLRFPSSNCNPTPGLESKRLVVRTFTPTPGTNACT